DGDVVAAISFRPDGSLAGSERAALFPEIARRVSNRRAGSPVDLDRSACSRLRRAVETAGMRAELLVGRDQIEAAGRIAGAAHRLAFSHPVLHDELFAELRWPDPGGEPS